MGYTTEFKGEFKFDRELDETTKNILVGLNKTRRMKRSVDKLAMMYGMKVSKVVDKWGAEGEFYYDNIDIGGQMMDRSVIDYNTAPSTQPSLQCCWMYDETNNSIKWDGTEKFYNYMEWIKYLIDRVIEPKGYVLNGEVDWRGEHPGDFGKLVVYDNTVLVE